VTNERLLQEARDFGADALLVSQVVTQKDCHRSNLAALIDLAEAGVVRLVAAQKAALA
jgi:beta-lysine 5,6-aminomutase beta subunit